jgi:thymidylate synthase
MRRKTMDEEYQYLAILSRLVRKLRDASPEEMEHGPQDITSVSIGLTTMTFDLSKGRLPLLTTKKVSFWNVLIELLWFLTGESKLDFLHKYNVRFWDAWATEQVANQYGLDAGDVGRIYGPNWIHWPDPRGGEVNQIEWVINGLKEHPEWRRWMITTLNPAYVDDAFLMPCHGTVHFVYNDGRLNLHHFQRSGDWFIGVPYNIASYALLLYMVCRVTGLKPGKLVQVTSNSHLYSNHGDVSETQLSREPLGFPSVTVSEKVTSIFEFLPEHFELNDYKYWPGLGAEVAL